MFEKGESGNILVETSATCGEELQEELRRIGEQVKSCAVPSFAWERAVIGKNDLILRRSTKEMHGQGTEVAEYDIPHYSEGNERFMPVCYLKQKHMINKQLITRRFSAL